jgi:UPF0716 family protein affecting phage T7 exclusion
VRRWLGVLLVAYPIVELATVILVAQWIGWGWTLLLVIIGIPVGLGVMRNAGGAAMADLRQAAATGVPPTEQGRHATTMLAGGLIAVPGFWTDLIGFALLVPPTRNMFRARAGSWANARMANWRMPGLYDPRGFSGDVIQGTVVKTDERPEQDASGRSPRELS